MGIQLPNPPTNVDPAPGRSREHEVENYKVVGLDLDGFDGLRDGEHNIDCVPRLREGSPNDVGDAGVVFHDEQFHETTCCMRRPLGSLGILTVLHGGPPSEVSRRRTGPTLATDHLARSFTLYRGALCDSHTFCAHLNGEVHLVSRASVQAELILAKVVRASLVVEENGS
jgi:hypothetical protein